MTTPTLSLEDAVNAIRPPDEDAMSRAVARQATLTKPPGSLGQLEELSIRLAGILRTEQPRIGGKAIIIAAADHGVVAQGVTAYPQDVTAQMVLNFLSGGAAINVMCRQLGIRQIIVDAGVATVLPSHPDLRSPGIGRGTADMTQGPAMTRSRRKRVWRRASVLRTSALRMASTSSAPEIWASATRRHPRPSPLS